MKNTQNEEEEGEKKPSPFEVFLHLMRESIKNEYLPHDWHNTKGDVILLDSNNYTLKSLCVNVNGTDMHSELDRELYEYDEINECYIDSENAVHAYGRRGGQFMTHDDECIYFGGEYYVLEYIGDNDIVCLYNGNYCNSDDANWVECENDYYPTRDTYYWESDEEYHVDAEEEEKDYEE